MTSVTGISGPGLAAEMAAREGLNPALDPAQAAVHEQARRVVNVTFLSALMRAMRKSVPQNGILDGGRGEEIFRQQLDAVLVDRMSENLVTPLADAIVRQAGVTNASPPRGWTA